MIRQALSSSIRRLPSQAAPRAFFSTAAAADTTDQSDDVVINEVMPFHHHRPQKGKNPKFKPPQKRASKLFHELNVDTCEKMRAAKPEVFGVDFAVGDAIEIEMIEEGGANAENPKTEKLRGVVIGRRNRGLGSAVYLRDVVFGEPIERNIQLFSPLIKSVKVLEKNFVYKGKRKVKRAKLYFLRDRNPIEYKVTKY